MGLVPNPISLLTAQLALVQIAGQAEEEEELAVLVGQLLHHLQDLPLPPLEARAALACLLPSLE